MKSSIQTGDPLQVTAGAIPFDELVEQIIRLPAPVTPWNALQLLEQLYPDLRWAGGSG